MTCEDRNRPAMLRRKGPSARGEILAMRGSLESLIRHFFDVPPKIRNEYLIRDGDNVFGPKEIEELARSFRIRK
jgi:hypothetical protein